MRKHTHTPGLPGSMVTLAVVGEAGRDLGVGVVPAAPSVNSSHRGRRQRHVPLGWWARTLLLALVAQWQTLPSRQGRACLSVDACTSWVSLAVLALFVPLGCPTLKLVWYAGCVRWGVCACAHVMGLLGVLAGGGGAGQARHHVGHARVGLVLEDDEELQVEGGLGQGRYFAFALLCFHRIPK